jgi:hypothetical protein
MAEWWQSDPSYARGVEIANNLQSAEPQYRDYLEPKRCIHCASKGQEAPIIMRVLVGPAAELVIWLPQHRASVNHPGPTADPPGRAETVPPRALRPVAGRFDVTRCRKCRYAQPFYITAKGGIDFSALPTPETRGRIVGN